MNHLTAQLLADYVRDLVSPEVRAQAEQHLATCQDCSAYAVILRKVREAASPVDVPIHLVTAAKALFVKPQNRWQPLLTRVVANLAAPAAGWQFAEVRSIEQTAQHSVYQWNDYFIDLRMDRESESPAVSLSGQIVNQKRPDQPLAGVPVTLATGANILVETISNEMGEFAIDFLPARSLMLRFDVRDAEVSIDVPLNTLKI